MRVWTPGFDMSSIPDAIFNAENGRRNSAKRKTHSGGVIWGEHNENCSRCRCAACNTARVKQRAKRAKLPKRRRGRPATIFNPPKAAAEPAERERILAEVAEQLGVSKEEALEQFRYAVDLVRAPNT